MEIECQECGCVFTSESIGADICPSCGTIYHGEQISETDVDELIDTDDEIYRDEEDIMDSDFNIPAPYPFDEDEEDEDSDPDYIYGKL